MRRMILFLLPLLLANSIHPSVAKEKNKDEFWYRNDYECAGYKITLHTFCVHFEDGSGIKICAKQNMEISRPDGINKKLYVQYLENEKVDYHRIGSITCVSGSNGKPYLDILLSNGGNCNTCEIPGVLDLHAGRWSRYGKIWRVSKKERQDINNKFDDWWEIYRKSAYFIDRNMQIEDDYHD